ncbi:hypothetical protein PSAB6_460106 [Paraburkholderia sabiae]|nr:hypothetical protein PSAB6_460106 [Paraburkholderia sabiae]
MGARAAREVRADGRRGRVALQGRRGRRARRGRDVRADRRGLGPGRVERDGVEERLDAFEPVERRVVADRQPAVAAAHARLMYRMWMSAAHRRDAHALQSAALCNTRVIRHVMRSRL